ncbi:MAG: hypothetical protein CL535_16630 [Ahrensia sp.]|nr:hypothetical protein [Ahrensia sp.]
MEARMKLRPYQTAAIESAIQALTIHGSAVMQMPTGAGKTRTATEIVKQHKKPVWFICHRQEIERQAAKAFTAAGIDFGIVSPRGKPEYDKPVQIVSVATLTRRINDLPLPSLAIWDECHHVAAKSWSAIREQLNGAQNLGLTATPERFDGKGLSEWFGELVVGPSTRELIDGGYLSDFRYFAPSDPDLASAKMQAGDYKKGDLDKVMNTPVLIGDAIAEYRKNADGKRALVFCASVDASKALVDRFNSEGIPAAHVDGTTPTDERDASVDALASGNIKVLSNVEVFTEGFDLPAIDVVILLRPTKSLALFLQMIGRALRTAEGKCEALIFDHAGLWLDHDWFDLPIEWSLDGGARQRRLAGRKHGPRRCPECKEVRVEREPVCECGYEFPTGSEIGECDGKLTELRRAVPSGCETREAFSRRIGCARFAMNRWISKGMPLCDGYVPIEDAKEWLKENPPRNMRPLFVDDPSEYESQKAFARRIGTYNSQVRLWALSGVIPCAKNGWIHIEKALDVVNSMRSNKIAKAKTKKKEKKRVANGSEIKADFARRIGVSFASVTLWCRNGLPNDCDGNIIIDDAIDWVEANTRTLIKVNDLTETQRSFEKRLKANKGMAYSWAARGMPLDKNRMVHVPSALEWVRENAKIRIPPDAWPPDSDRKQKPQPTAA